MDTDDDRQAVKEQFKALKIQATRDRCQALALALSRLEHQIHASPAILHVVAALRVATDSLKAHLERQRENADLDLLNDDELEGSLHLTSKVLPYLHTILGLIERVDATAVPLELIAPFRRQVQKLFPGAELIIVSDPGLNYSIVEISEHIRDILHYLRCELPPAFPALIFRASVPSVEFDQALLHSILSHEFGHPLFQRYRIAQRVLPIDIDQNLLRKMYVSLVKKSTESQDVAQFEFPYDEINFRSVVTSGVNELVHNWVRELSADLFGLLIFGPAYLYAFVYFSSSFQLLDSASETHPPARLRLLALFNLLEERYKLNRLSGRAKSFLAIWRGIARRPVQGSTILEQVALHSIQQDEFLSRLGREIASCLPAGHRYSQKRYEDDLRRLVPLINTNVPPAGYFDGNVTHPERAVGILNAAWEVYLDGLESFGRNFPRDTGHFQVGLKFNKFIMKSLELNEVILAWREASQ